MNDPAAIRTTGWWWNRRCPSMITTATGQFNKAFVAMLRTPGLFLIDNYFKTFRDNWSPRQLDWNLAISHFALFAGFLLLVVPLSHLKRYFVHLVCWFILIYVTRSFFYLDHLSTNLVVAAAAETSFNHVSNHHNETEPLCDDQHALNILLLFFHLTFDVIIVLLLQAPATVLRFGLVGYAIMATVGFNFGYLSSQVLNLLSYVIFFSSLIGYFIRHTPMLFNDVKMWTKTIVNIGISEGVGILFLKIFQQIFVPMHFLLFWALTFLVKLYNVQMLIENGSDEHDWTYVLLNITSSIFLSPVALLATSITVTYMSSFVLTTIKLYLWGSGQNNNIIHHPNVNPNPNVYRDHNGWEEGVTTLLLTSITAFSDINEDTRMAITVIISFVVISSLLQSILEISEPAILSLNANHNCNRIHHMKVLLLCAFLFLFPIYVTYVYAQIFPVNFWIAVVFSTSLLISARVLDLVIIHCLFWWDSCRSEPWEGLDEVIYYARSFTKILEFLISISVVVVGVWEAVNNRSNIINGTILVMHCYFNVCQRINHGLASYFRRRAAAKIVDSLAVADNTCIDQYDDLCSICYVDLHQRPSSAMVVIVTQCNHLFHRQCIKKWLSIQNRCPMCAAIITTTNGIGDSTDDTKTTTTTTATTT